MPARAPRLVVIAGPNGAGKTTSSGALLRDLFGIKEFVNADSIAHGMSAFNAEAAAFAAGRTMIGRLRELAAQQQDFAFETTLASRTFAPWIAELQERGYAFGLLFLWLPTPEIAVARVAQRSAAGGHGVPEETIRRRFDRGLANFFALYRPIADQWYLCDNSSRRARLVASGSRMAAAEFLDEETWTTLEARHARRS